MIIILSVRLYAHFMVKRSNGPFWRKSNYSICLAKIRHISTGNGMSLYISHNIYRSSYITNSVTTYGTFFHTGPCTECRRPFPHTIPCMTWALPALTLDACMDSLFSEINFSKNILHSILLSGKYTNSLQPVT